MTNTWGSELWDQFEAVKKHTDKGIEFLHKFYSFARDRQAIENEYALKLKQLVKKYQPSKKDEDAYNRFTCTKSFVALLKELNSVALQHETISENIISMVSKDAFTLVSELKAEKKQIIKEGEKEEKKLADSIDALNRVKKHYEQAHRAFEQAKSNYSRADNDVNQTKATVEKLKAVLTMKDQLREESKNEYILQLQKTNTSQKEHYFTNMPAVFQKMQTMDERRIESLCSYYKKYSESQNLVIPILVKCLESMVQEADKINPHTDSGMVIDKYKSGYVPHADIAFEDLDAEPAYQSKPADTDSISSEIDIPVLTGNGSGSGTVAAKKKRNKRMGLFSKKDTDSPDRKNRILQKPSFRRKFKTKKFDEPKEDFSHLQPNQQKKKLTEKIDELSGKIDKEQKEREGLLKMRDVYTKSPQLGDPTSVDGQLQQIGKRMDDYRLELQKYQSYMEKAEGKTASFTKHSKQATDAPQNPKAQQNNVTSPPPPDFTSSIPAPPPFEGLDSTPSSTTSEIISSADANSTFEDGKNSTDDRVIQRENTFDDDEFVDASFEAVLCTCLAIYPFESSEGSSLSLHAEEIYDVMEYDSGDGWTRVRRGNDEGYVPTSYIQLQDS